MSGKYDNLKIMKFKFPKNDDKYYWTNHVGRKMMFYGLSADRIKRVMRSPQRSENGIAEGTIAVMHPAGSKARPSEVWVMYQAPSKRGKGRKIVITAWRYPGISPVRDEIPIPADILEELKRDGIIK
ncbi:MAG: hypothetical protein A3A32_03155 [Candidatus Wildermuthbacteria bacterium RIFCSPLOWO2_01_FULL_48_35]|uniref:DUF4258 domain-containing protein n=2 Tax=Parcubacteria group TaxID=1794811 RepID=A0A1G2RPP1_9BACT|nr:MAG: hypothetical protein A3A32_03155 [Candidatus Wildermuthbacteria bacterium RIFCSPLOWO2_01_FULL_48_35]